MKRRIEKREGGTSRAKVRRGSVLMSTPAKRPMPAGYSGTPLPKKLGITESTQIVLIRAPSEYESLIGSLPPGATFGAALS